MRRSWCVVGGCLAIAVMASACGSDVDDDSAGPSGGTAGAGGSGGASSGTGGAMGGTAGQGGTGGAGGAGGGGGAGVLAPPSPGIACRDATCDEDSQQCCGDDGPSLACYPPAACQGLIQLGCDDSVDCPGQVCCFGAFLVNARIGTGCGSECRSSGLYNVQVCREANDCDNGDSCHTFVCGGFDTGNVTLGLCTATAPEFCE